MPTICSSVNVFFIARISYSNFSRFSPSTWSNFTDAGHGENGSGKSSLYLGLKDFFCAFDTTWTIEPLPTHLKAKSQYDYEVKVDFKSPEKSFIFKGDSLKDENIGQTFLLDSFLSYREMLKTHFIDKNQFFEEKFYELLTETLIAEHEFGSSTIGDALKDLQGKLSESTDKAELLKAAKKVDPDYEEGDLEEINPKKEIDNFKTLFDEKLEEISIPLNEILTYFNQAIKVKFQKLDIEFNEKKELRGRLGLDVNYIDIDHIKHLEILNEARLSALAISIYLAAIVTNPIVKKDNYKILFLDDVFIGLDTSNRLPLLEILQNFEVDKARVDGNGEVVKNENDEPLIKKVKFFEDFQIFITTYDRHWFEIAKKSLGNSWLFVEMYVGKKDKLNFEYPIIISPSDTYYEKAEKYANRKKNGNDKDIDFPAAGNYLRKEVESILKDLLWGKYRFKNGEKGQTIIREELQDLWDSFALMMNDLGLSLKSFAEFGLLSKCVFNPFSHDNLEKPIYRAEIEKAFVFVDELRTVKKSDLLNKGDNIHLKIKDLDENVRQYKMKAKDAVFVFQQAGTKTTNALVVEFECEKYYSDEVETSFQRHEGKLSKLFDKVTHSILSQNNASNGKNMLNEFVEINGKTIQQLIDEI